MSNLFVMCLTEVEKESLFKQVLRRLGYTKYESWDTYMRLCRIDAPDGFDSCVVMSSLECNRSYPTKEIDGALLAGKPEEDLLEDILEFIKAEHWSFRGVVTAYE